MLGGQQDLVRLQYGGERGVARLPRRCFEALSGGGSRVNVADFQGHPQRPALPFRVPGPNLGIWMQAMIDVHGGEVVGVIAAADCATDVSQYRRIESAAVRDPVAGCAGAPRQFGGYRLDERCVGHTRVTSGSGLVEGTVTHQTLVAMVQQGLDRILLEFCEVPQECFL